MYAMSKCRLSFLSPFLAVKIYLSVSSVSDPWATLALNFIIGDLEDAEGGNRPQQEGVLVGVQET